MKLRKVLATALVSVFTLSSVAVHSPAAYAATIESIASGSGIGVNVTDALNALNLLPAVTKENMDTIGKLVGKDLADNANAVLATLEAIKGANITQNGSTFTLSSNVALPSNLNANEKALAQKLLDGFKEGLDSGSNASTMTSLFSKYGVSVGAKPTPTPTPTPVPPTTVTPPTTISTGSTTTAAPVATAAPVVTKEEVTLVITPDIKEKDLANKINDLKKIETEGKAAVVAFAAAVKEGKANLTVNSDIVSKLHKGTSAAVEIVTSIASLNFDHASLGAILDVAGKVAAGKKADVKFDVQTVAASTLTKLSEESRAIVGERPVFDFNVTANGKKVSDFKGGTVNVSVPYTPAKDENTNALVVCYVGDDGKLTPVKGAYKNGKFEMALKHFSQYVITYNPVTFKDVAKDNAFYNAITFGAARGYFSADGVGEGNFKPEATATRAMILKTAMDAFGIAPDKTPKVNFTDVKADSEYAGYTAAAKRLKIDAGVNAEGTLFAPEKAMTNEEMYKLLFNVLTYTKSMPSKPYYGEIQFKDFVNVSKDAKPAVIALIGAKVVTGTDGKLNPKAEVTRGEMAKIICAALSK